MECDSCREPEAEACQTRWLPNAIALTSGGFDRVDRTARSCTGRLSRPRGHGATVGAGGTIGGGGEGGERERGGGARVGRWGVVAQPGRHGREKSAGTMGEDGEGGGEGRVTQGQSGDRACHEIQRGRLRRRDALSRRRPVTVPGRHVGEGERSTQPGRRAGGSLPPDCHHALPRLPQAQPT